LGYDTYWQMRYFGYKCYARMPLAPRPDSLYYQTLTSSKKVVAACPEKTQ
jgi:hypothetical protein